MALADMFNDPARVQMIADAMMGAAQGMKRGDVWGGVAQGVQQGRQRAHQQRLLGMQEELFGMKKAEAEREAERRRGLADAFSSYQSDGDLRGLAASLGKAGDVSGAVKVLGEAGGGGPFQGAGIEAQTYRILVKGARGEIDTTSPEYRLAYTRAGSPTQRWTPEGPVEIPGMDLSGFPAPGSQQVTAAPPRIGGTARLPQGTDNGAGVQVAPLPGAAPVYAPGPSLAGGIPQQPQAQPAGSTGVETVDLGGGVTLRRMADPKEQRAEELQRQRKESRADLLSDEILRTITLLDQEGTFNPITGHLGDLAARVNPEGQAATVRNLLETVGGNIGFGELQQMREASPTGGALGSVSEQENRTLKALQGNLTASQDAAELRYNLARYHNFLMDTVHGAGNGPARLDPGDPPSKGGDGIPDEDPKFRALDAIIFGDQGAGQPPAPPPQDGGAPPVAPGSPSVTIPVTPPDRGGVVPPPPADLPAWISDGGRAAFNIARMPESAAQMLQMRLQAAIESDPAVARKVPHIVMQALAQRLASGAQ